jgi:hypothetical protein
LIEDWAFRGHPLSETAENSLEYAIEDTGLTVEQARHLIREAVQATGAQFYSEDNPPPWIQQD